MQGNEYDPEVLRVSVGEAAACTAYLVSMSDQS